MSLIASEKKSEGVRIFLFYDKSVKSQAAIRMLKEAKIPFETTKSSNIAAPCVFAPEGKFKGLEGIKAFVHLRLSQY